MFLVICFLTSTKAACNCYYFLKYVFKSLAWDELSVFLALLSCVQWLSPLFHLAISFKMSSEVLIMNFSYLLYTLFHVKFLVLSVPHIHPIQFNIRIIFFPYVWHSVAFQFFFLATLLEWSGMWTYFLYYIATFFRRVSSGFR